MPKTGSTKDRCAGEEQEEEEEEEYYVVPEEEEEEDSETVGLLKRIKPHLLQLDLFPYDPSDEEYVPRSTSILGAIGTVLAVAVLSWFIVTSLLRFAADETETSITVRARTDKDFLELNKMGMILYSSGKAFYDERLFQIKYKLRAIFDGDLNNDVRPRIYIDVPAKTCTLYNTETLEGKNATSGCPDMDAAIEELARMKLKSTLATEAKDSMPHNKPNDIPSSPIIQGTYGTDAYWFLEARLEPCVSNDGGSDDENIACYNETVVQQMFLDSNVNFNADMAMLSQISREDEVWTTMYMNVEYSRWKGFETYFQKTFSYETDRVFPGITKDPLSFSAFKSYLERTDSRVDSDGVGRSGHSYMAFYFRLDPEVREVTIIHYSLFDMLNSIGGSWEMVMVAFAAIFVYLNYRGYRSRQQKKKERSSSCPKHNDRLETTLATSDKNHSTTMMDSGFLTDVFIEEVVET